MFLKDKKKEEEEEGITRNSLRYETIRMTENKLTPTLIHVYFFFYSLEIVLHLHFCVFYEKSLFLQ